jgi:membrane-bound serine protease (ClpP class)
MGTVARLLPVVAMLSAGAALAESRVVAVTFDGVIHPITVEIVGRVLAQAEREDARLVLIRLNTPGGLLDSTRQLVEKIVASPTPVAAYVTPSGGRAASAGFFILQAADIAAMAPGTNTGAASPVLLGGKMDPVMRRKAESDASAALRTVVQKRARNSELAEKAVLEAKAFTEKEALENNLIELIAASEKDLLEKLNGREITRFNGKKQTLRLAAAQVVEYKKTTREALISSIADPNIAFILLVIGALGIYVEFSSPGLIAPGVAGAIALLLGLSALSVLPINWVGVALLVLAVTLFVLEAKFASHGILGAGGAVAMMLGALLLVEGPPEIRIRLGTAIAVTLPFAAITIFLVALVMRARSNKVVSGPEGMIGELGSAYTALSPAGKVFIHGEYWDAISSMPVEAGARVQVTAVDGLTVQVEPIGAGSGDRNA